MCSTHCIFFLDSSKITLVPEVFLETFLRGLLSFLKKNFKKNLWDQGSLRKHSFLFAAGDVSRGETSATQRRKFHTDDANQCLHNKSGSHGVPNIHLSNFTCFLVDFGKVLCSSANELQQNSDSSSREDYIPQTSIVLLEILRVYI